MFSNTKLNPAQKSERKLMLAQVAALGGFVFSFPEYSVTVAIVPKFEGSNFSDVAIAIASPGEKKFRRKVGEYYALTRWSEGQIIAVPTPANVHAFTLELASLVSGNTQEYVYDSEGFGRDGFDAEGFDSEGFGRDGFDAEGFDRNGFDSEGFDSEVFDSEGF